MIESKAALPVWRPEKSRMRIEMFLSQEAMASSELMTAQLGGFEVRSTMLDPGLPVPADSARKAQAIVVELRIGQTSSQERLQRLLADFPDLPVIAAISDPSLGDVRTLMRGGIADVLPLPLKRTELEAALDRIRGDIEAIRERTRENGSIVSVVKSRGGVGATTILTQLARIAARSASGREVSLVDFDLQSGNAAFYLGELPALGIKDLIDAGARADGALMRTTMTRHACGLHYLAAPPEIMPLETVSSEQIMSILDLMAQEFGTIFVDLPASWTDWSLSTIARSDLVLFVSELNVANLHQARKQLDLIRQQDLGDIPLHIVMNKVEKKFFRTLDFDDAVKILGREVSWSVAEDWETVNTALDQGAGVDEVAPRSRTARDLKAIAESLPEILVQAKKAAV